MMASIDPSIMVNMGFISVTVSTIKTRYHLKKKSDLNYKLHVEIGDSPRNEGWIIINNGNH